MARLSRGPGLVPGVSSVIGQRGRGLEARPGKAWLPNSSWDEWKLGGVVTTRWAIRLLSVSCLLIVTGCSGGDGRPRAARAVVDSPRAATESVSTRVDPAAFAAAQRERRASKQHLIEDWQVADLKREGLTDPVPMLVADLERHPELIPYPGVLGGTMGFYDSTAIHVLDDQWVYAYFEDGHISGYGLFRYRILPGGRIQWRKVVAHRDD